MLRLLAFDEHVITAPGQASADKCGEEIEDAERPAAYLTCMQLVEDDLHRQFALRTVALLASLHHFDLLRLLFCDCWSLRW